MFSLPRKHLPMLARAPFASRTASNTITRRTFQTSRARFFPRQDTKDDLKPESNEYSKSGSDSAAAAVEDTAFNPNTTRPEEEHAKAGKESNGDTNPLNVSPANHDISQPRDPKEGGAEGSEAETGSGGGRKGGSGGGSPKKSGGGKSGGGGAF